MLPAETPRTLRSYRRRRAQPDAAEPIRVPDRHELQELPIGVLQLLLRALGKVSPAPTIFERPPAFLEEGIPKAAVFLRPFSIGQILSHAGHAAPRLRLRPDGGVFRFVDETLMVTRGAAAVDPGVERGGGLDAGMTEQLPHALEVSGRMIEHHLRAHMPELMRRQQNAFPLLEMAADQVSQRRLVLSASIHVDEQVVGLF